MLIKLRPSFQITIELYKSEILTFHPPQNSLQFTSLMFSIYLLPDLPCFHNHKIPAQPTLFDVMSVVAPKLLVNTAVKEAMSIALINNQIIPTMRPTAVFGVLSPYLKQ